MSPKSTDGTIVIMTTRVHPQQKHFIVTHHHTFECALSCGLSERQRSEICLSVGQMEQMFTAFPPDVAGNLDYKNLVHIITHGEEKDQE